MVNENLHVTYADGTDTGTYNISAGKSLQYTGDAIRILGSLGSGATFNGTGSFQINNATVNIYSQPIFDNNLTFELINGTISNNVGLAEQLLAAANLPLPVQQRLMGH